MILQFYKASKPISIKKRKVTKKTSWKLWMEKQHRKDYERELRKHGITEQDISFQEVMQMVSKSTQ